MNEDMKSLEAGQQDANSASNAVNDTPEGIRNRLDKLKKQIQKGLDRESESRFIIGEAVAEVSARKMYGIENDRDGKPYGNLKDWIADKFHADVRTVLWYQRMAIMLKDAARYFPLNDKTGKPSINTSGIVLAAWKELCRLDKQPSKDSPDQPFLVNLPSLMDYSRTHTFAEVKAKVDDLLGVTAERQAKESADNAAKAAAKAAEDAAFQATEAEAANSVKATEVTISLTLAELDAFCRAVLGKGAPSCGDTDIIGAVKTLILKQGQAKAMTAGA